MLCARSCQEILDARLGEKPPRVYPSRPPSPPLAPPLPAQGAPPTASARLQQEHAGTRDGGEGERMEQSAASIGQESPDHPDNAGRAREKSMLWEQDSSDTADRSDTGESERSDAWTAASALAVAAGGARAAAGASSQKLLTRPGCHLDPPGLPPPSPLALRATLVRGASAFAVVQEQGTCAPACLHLRCSTSCTACSHLPSANQHPSALRRVCTCSTSCLYLLHVVFVGGSKRTRRGADSCSLVCIPAWNATHADAAGREGGVDSWGLPTGHVQGYSHYQHKDPEGAHGLAKVAPQRLRRKNIDDSASASASGPLGFASEDEKEEGMTEGGWAFEEGDIVVPDMHSNVPEAVLLAHDKAYGSDSVLLRSGQHSWTTYNYGRIEVLRSLRVKGESGTLLVGRWLLLQGSCGSLHSLRALSRTPSSQTERYMYDATLYWRDARGWRVVNCDVRSAGSIAALVTRSSRVAFVRCTMGGALERRYVDDFDELYCASEALTVLGSAHVRLDQCRLQDSFGPACSLMGKSVSRIRASVFARSSIGTVFDWDCRSVSPRVVPLSLHAACCCCLTCCFRMCCCPAPLVAMRPK